MFFFFSLFFFQAEDGIRDLYVTGVQTCALPIYGERPRGRLLPPAPDHDEPLAVRGDVVIAEIRQLEEGLRQSGAKLGPRLDADRHQVAAASVEELPAIVRPDRSGAAIDGDLRSPPGAGVGHDIDLETSRLVRLIGDPAAVRREPRRLLVGRSAKKRTQLAISRQ